MQIHFLAPQCVLSLNMLMLDIDSGYNYVCEITKFNKVFSHILFLWWSIFVICWNSVLLSFRLKASGTPVRFCTNETTTTVDKIVSKLGKMGFDMKTSEVFAPIPAVRKVLQQRALRPHLLVHQGTVYSGQIMQLFLLITCDTQGLHLQSELCPWFGTFPWPQ